MKTLALVLTLLFASTALAIDQPPTEPAQQRAWLAEHVVADMHTLGTFRDKDFLKVPRLIEELNDEEVALVTQFYYLTRSKAELDAGVAVQQQDGMTVEQASQPVAELLPYIQQEAVACYQQLASVPYLAQVVYASVPGWCANSGYYVPDSYYAGDAYVGGCYDAVYAGRWAAPVYGCYADHGSVWYNNYTKVKSVWHDNSINIYRNRADWYKNNDWRGHYAHNAHVAHHGNTHAGRTDLGHRNSYADRQGMNSNKTWKHGGQYARSGQQGGQHASNFASNGKTGKHGSQSFASNGKTWKHGNQSFGQTRPQNSYKPQQHAHARPQSYKPQSHASRPTQSYKPQSHASAPRPQARPQQHAQARPQMSRPQSHASRPTQSYKPQQHAQARPQMSRPQSHASPRPQQHSAPRPQSHASARPSGGGGGGHAARPSGGGHSSSGGHGGGRGRK